MKVTFYSGFSKRFNSTKRPTGGVTKSVTLKDKTSLRNPSFKVEDDGVGYDYCSCGTWYYYVTDKVYYPNNIIEYKCELDVLATNKTAISNLNCYIERCSQAQPNLYITDPYNTPTGEIILESTDLFTLSSASGFVMVCNGTNGAFGYYLTLSELKEIFTELNTYEEKGTIERSLITRAKECIAKIIKVPYKDPHSGEASVEVIIGDYTTNVTAHAINLGDIISDSVFIDKLKFPSNSWVGEKINYLNFEPFTTGYIYLPFVGNIPLDVSIFGASGNIGVEYYIDAMTSEILYKIYAVDINNVKRFLSSYSGVCGSQVPFINQQMDYNGATQAKYQEIGGGLTVGVGIGSLALGAINPLLGVGAVVGGVVSYLSAESSYNKAIEIHTSTNGSVSSYLGYKLGLTAKVLILTKKPTYTNIVELNNIYGMPFGKVGTISDVDKNGGYIKTKNCNFVGGAFNTNNETRALLDSGIYYE